MHSTRLTRAGQPRGIFQTAARLSAVFLDLCTYLALFSGVAQAQHREPLPATPDIATAEEGQEGERWFIQREEVELAELLDAFASIEGIPLDYDRSVVKGRVSLRTAAGLSSEELWSLVNRWLAASGQACIQ